MQCVLNQDKKVIHTSSSYLSRRTITWYDPTCPQSTSYPLRPLPSPPFDVISAKPSLALALALSPYSLSFAISSAGGWNQWGIETFLKYDIYKRVGPFSGPTVCLYLLDLGLLELRLSEPHLLDLSLLDLHDIDLNLFEFHLLGPIIYLVHSSTWSTHLLGSLVYSVLSSTWFTHLLGPLIYSVHSSTRSTHLLGPHIYSIYSVHSSTRSTHLLGQLIYPVYSSTRSTHLLCLLI